MCGGGTKLTQKIVEFLCLSLFYFSVFLHGFQKLGEQANILSSFWQCLFFCSSINWSTDFCKAGKRRLSAVLQPLFSFFWQFCWDIIQTKNLNVLTFWQSCQNKTFNENTKLPKTRLLLVGTLWSVETFYSQAKKRCRFSDWLNKGANHVFTQVDSNRITQYVWNKQEIPIVFIYFFVKVLQ